jgi:thymidylate synthase (FAD)
MNTVELQGTYGGDESHALSAWTSTSRDLDPEKHTRIPQLLTFLAVNGHHTPFEKSMIHVLIRCETASHIHILKHRIGVSVNGESPRYKQLQEPSFHIPEDWPTEIQLDLLAHCARSRMLYEEALAELEPVLGRKRAKESARFFLPYANQLTLDVSFNFRSLMHFAGLRAKDDAQDEIHDIADQIITLLPSDFQHSLTAFGY